MARKAKTAGKNKGQTQEETSESIAAQIAEFLAAGGEIDQIASGVSGQQSVSGRKHITISNKA